MTKRSAKPSWDTVYQTPKEKYISMLITENAVEVSRKIRKRWLGFGSITL
jgi:hypothetical protein